MPWYHAHFKAEGTAVQTYLQWSSLETQTIHAIQDPKLSEINKAFNSGRGIQTTKTLPSTYILNRNYKICYDGD